MLGEAAERPTGAVRGAGRPLGVTVLVFRVGAWFTLLLGAALAPLSAGCSYSIVRDARVNDLAAQRIERGIAKLRELPFRTSVPIEVKSVEELRGYLARELAREYTPQELSALSRVYERLGLVSGDVDIGSALLRLYSAQVAGFYDPHEAKLFLVPSGVPSPGIGMQILQFIMRRDLVNEMLLAHELTHALQDQNFGTLALADDPDDDDRALAVRAVLEGDATLAGIAYVFGGLRPGSVVDLVGRLEAIPGELAELLPETPAVLREQLVFQYAAGARFVAEAYLAAGWRGVDALLAYPPRSTEQILWPEKYFDSAARDDPTEIRLGGLDDYRQGRDWTCIEENTLGELTIRILANGYFDRERAVRVAAGWDGDRLAAYRREDAIVLFWMSAWDSESDARDFFAAEHEILEHKYPAGILAPAKDRASADGAQPWSLERRGDKVLVVIGVPSAERSKREAAVWTGTAFAPSSIHRDLDLAQVRRNSSP